MRRRTRAIAIAGAVVLTVTSALPATASVVPASPAELAAGPDRAGSDDRARVSDPRPSDFADAAVSLPEGLVAALERDLRMSPEEYLVEAQRGIDAAAVVTALLDDGVTVNGGELDDDEVVIYVDSAEDVPAVESTGARAVVGQQERSDPTGIELEAVDDLFGGEGWGYQVSSSTSLTCSIGVPGYNANGDDVIATAGHCFGLEKSSTGTTQYNDRLADPRSMDRTQPRQFGGSSTPGDWIGTLVPGSKQFGSGTDVALLTTSYSNAILHPQVAQWGGSGFAPDDAGSGAPLDSEFRLTGATAGFDGAPICKSGSTTGWTCGTISEVDWNVSVSGKIVNSVMSDVCVIPGDSGGIAVVGTAAVGITSGSGFGTPPVGEWCDPTVPNPFSVFFHMIDPGIDGDTFSVADKYGDDWTPCTGPVPVVSSLAPGGDPDGPAALKGKVPCVVAGVATDAALYLDGSPTALATTTPSGTAGSFDFSLEAVTVGAHDYEIVVSWGSETSSVSGSLDIAERSDLPSRLAGDDRYATAAAIGSEWDESFDADVVFVATGENYPDALSAAAAAAYMGAPVLLTKKSSLPSVVKSRLNALHPDTIIVLGSTASISSSVFNDLKTVSGSPSVTRFSGSDRYDTARKIIDYAFDDGADGLVDVPSVVIATGRNFPDALSAAPAVARDGGAVILVDGSASSIPSATLSVVDDLDPDQIYIAGTTTSVKAAIETQLDKRYGDGIVTRIAGSDRYETSRMLTDRYWGDAPAVFFAVGTKYPDALAGAALAGALGAPLLVTEKSCMSSSTRSLVLALDAEERVLLGSSASISSTVASLQVC